jgi:glycosyltransferase involved in cell wall biosynthesis
LPDAPLVSVVVPTFQRSDLVGRAVRSALAQTMGDLEIIVVVDGRDPATRGALAAIDDPRLTVWVPDRHLGNADARNEGVRRARGRWVAFLDDDDEWMPQKVERQIATATRAACARPIVSCRILARSEAGDMLWPRRWIAPGEDWSEYFFCRRTPFTGEGMTILSAILTSHALAVEVPFTAGLGRHVDPDWLLRAARLPGVCLELAPGNDPLVVWHIERERSRITTRRDWAASYAWCRANRHLFSPRGYAAFVLHVVGSNAAAQRQWRAFPLLLREACARGRPAPVDLVSHVGNFVLPARMQRRMAAWYARLATAAK